MELKNKSSRFPSILIGLIWSAAFVSFGFCLLVNLDIIKIENKDQCIQAGIWGGITLSALGMGLTCLSFLSCLKKVHLNSNSMVADLRRIMSGQTQSEAILTQINENILLSDKIKSVAFREKDRSILEQAIREDMRMERWDSAKVLINVMQEQFGCDKEAKALMEELDWLKNGTIQEKIDAALSHIESLWMIHHYDEAEKEIQTLLRLYPEDTRLTDLVDETKKRRENHKKELLSRWATAVKNDDIDQGVELLKLLDDYLTPTEGAALEEAARGVFRAKLHNMGVRFSLFVTEKKWPQALAVGKEIVKEFPNSRMAQEVREKLEILEQRAQG